MNHADIMNLVFIRIYSLMRFPERYQYFPSYSHQILKNKQNLCENWASQVTLMVKNLSANVGDVRDARLIPGLGRFPEEGHGNPLQCSCLENSMDRGAWRATGQSDMTEATFLTGIILELGLKCNSYHPTFIIHLLST